MSFINKYFKYPAYITVLAVLVAALFLSFGTSPQIKELLKFLVFPGVLFVLLGGLFYNWFDRKLFARMQNRIGPRFIQPVYDMLKLLAKEDITPDGVDRPEFDWIPAIQVFLAFFIAFFIPIYTFTGLISFTGDLVFIMFLLALLGGSIFLLGWASNNPYGLLGASRAAVAEFSFEIPLALSFAGPAILARSIRISELSLSKYTLLNLPLGLFNATISAAEIIYILPLLILFFISILASTALLEKVPFDPAHAEVEIVGGWTVEISGKKLFFTQLANFILEISLAGIIAAIFLGGPGANAGNFNLLIIGGYDVVGYLVNIASFAIKTSFVVFLITLMRTLHSRIRIDQLVKYFWKYYLPLAMFGIFLIILFKGVIV
ncbi:MAG: complex I subunit 1 family protein [Candidatus Hodarchaeales archaeon]